MTPVARIDHVLYGVQDLDLAAGRLEADHGLVAAGGGSHGELGTANRLIPLGDQYLELITVADPASQHPLAVVLGAVLLYPAMPDRGCWCAMPSSIRRKTRYGRPSARPLDRASFNASIAAPRAPAVSPFGMT